MLTVSPVVLGSDCLMNMQMLNYHDPFCLVQTLLGEVKDNMLLAN